MIKKDILNNIENSYITKDKLINTLDITSEKLEKHMNELLNDGYDIIYDSSKGYKLKYAPDILKSYELSRHLETNYIAQDIYYYDEVESTNITAKELLDENISEGSVIIAERQSAGKSRKGTDWESPEGGIWMTIVLNPNVSLKEASKITILTGVAIAKTLNEGFNINAGIKWPNDIFIDSKKTCGILTEAITEDSTLTAVLLGIGIDVNISEDRFSDEVKDIAISLNKKVDDNIRRVDILKVFFKIFEELYDDFRNNNFNKIIDEWRKLNITLGNKVKVSKGGEDIIATAIGINENGALIIEHDNGSLDKITSGECIIINDENTFF